MAWRIFRRREKPDVKAPRQYLPMRGDCCLTGQPPIDYLDELAVRKEVAGHAWLLCGAASERVDLSDLVFGRNGHLARNGVRRAAWAAFLCER